MNPLTAAIAGIASILGIGSSLVNQGVIIHRELHQPPPLAQQQCLPPSKLEVIVLANGQKQLICTEVQGAK